MQDDVLLMPWATSTFDLLKSQEDCVVICLKIWYYCAVL